MGFSQPTPIQEQAIPVVLSGHDLIACAQTGTGKTAAYVLPLMNRIMEQNSGSSSTLILAPTRELALQIDQQVEALGYFTGISSIAIYGGGDGMTWDLQKKAIREGVDIIIATPGRLISHMATGDIRFPNLKYLVLDEADRMLDMGFFDDIMRIVSNLPKERQTLLFSATMPQRIRQLANGILKHPKQVNIAISKPAEGILQKVYMVEEPAKQPLLELLLNEGGYNSVLIFASTKEKVKKLGSVLSKSGLDCKAFSSELDQTQREEIMRSFKNKNLRILVGTDVLSRGIDVEGIDLVVNYDVPPDPEDYVHRIGRTARAERTGTAVTFVNNQDFRKFERIGQLTGLTIPIEPLPESIKHLSIAAPHEPPGKHRGNFKSGHHRRNNHTTGKAKPSGHGSGHHRSGSRSNGST
ncbi:MAG TPA: DEAD/DEAH box helicase [Bacteroidia bacterium]|nr:DEAD/DEAH box helicase [Bacteroidia bacterium]